MERDPKDIIFDPDHPVESWLAALIVVNATSLSQDVFIHGFIPAVQKAVVEALDEADRMGITLEVRSKTELPQAFRDWLREVES